MPRGGDKGARTGTDENARAEVSETSGLRPGNHVARRLTKAERQAEGKFRSLFKGAIRYCQF